MKVKLYVYYNRYARIYVREKKTTIVYCKKIGFRLLLWSGFGEAVKGQWSFILLWLIIIYTSKIVNSTKFYAEQIKFEFRTLQYKLSRSRNKNRYNYVVWCGPSIKILVIFTNIHMKIPTSLTLISLGSMYLGKFKLCMY